MKRLLCFALLAPMLHASEGSPWARVHALGPSIQQSFAQVMEDLREEAAAGDELSAAVNEYMVAKILNNQDIMPITAEMIDLMRRKGLVTDFGTFTDDTRIAINALQFRRTHSFYP